jgi:hypothetical protein
MLADYRGKGGLFGKLADAVPEGTSSSGFTTPLNGPFRSIGPPDAQLVEVQRARCFQTGRYSVGDRGLHSVTEQAADDVSLPHYFGAAQDAARRVMEVSAAKRDTALLDYFVVRKTMGWAIHRFFGDPGLEVAATRFATPDHQAAIELLRQRLADPRFASALNPLSRAEIEVLVAAPQDFVSCTARRAREQKKA